MKKALFSVSYAGLWGQEKMPLDRCSHHVGAELSQVLLSHHDPDFHTDFNARIIWRETTAASWRRTRRTIKGEKLGYRECERE